MTATEMHNLTVQCDWFNVENRTELRVTGQLDFAGCVFLSLMPNGQSVPLLICVFVLLTLFSFLVNGIILFELGRTENLSCQPRFILLKNLVFSDLLQTVTFSPAVIQSLVYRRTMKFNSWCLVQYFTGTASVFSSLVTITCMALERYLYVCHAIHYIVILTETRLRIILSLIWGYSIATGCVNVLLLLHMGKVQNSTMVTLGLLCEPDVVEQHMGFPRSSAVFRKLIGFLTLLLCLLTYTFSYVSMYRDASKAVIPFNTVNATARKTVLFYCGMLFLQLLPVLLKTITDTMWEVKGTVAMTAVSSHFQDRPLKATPSSAAAILHLSLLVMLLVPPCINPLVYGLRSAEIRRALWSRFHHWSAAAQGVEAIRVRDVVPHQDRPEAG